MAEVPLGSLHVYTRDSEFELILASSIKFTASEEDEVEDLRERLTANQLTENSSPRPYLYCVDSCSLLILLQCDAELATDEQHMLIETFSAQIQTAMLWQQLHFSQPSLRTEVAADGRVRMELTLTRTEEMSKIGPRTPHKLGLDVPFYDTRAPSGVSAATIDSVLLTAVIRQRHGSINTRRLHHDAFDKQDDHLSFYTGCTNPNADHSKATMASSGYIDNHRIADEVFFAIEPEERAIVDLEEHTLVKPEDARDSRIGNLLRLLDVAVRRSISASTAASRQVSIEIDESFHSLSTVAPAVFRADHLPAVASRALFLHTISQSVGAVASRCITTKTLNQHNTDCLSSWAKSSSSKAQHKSKTNECSDLIGQKQNVQVPHKLWAIVDETLLDLMPERRLQPISQNNNGENGFDAETQLSNALEEADQQFDFEAGSNSDFEDIDLEERRFREDEDEDFEDMLDLNNETEINNDEQNDESGCC